MDEQDLPPGHDESWQLILTYQPPNGDHVILPRAGVVVFELGLHELCSRSDCTGCLERKDHKLVEVLLHKDKWSWFTMQGIKFEHIYHPLSPRADELQELGEEEAHLRAKNRFLWRTARLWRLPHLQEIQEHYGEIIRSTGALSLLQMAILYHDIWVNNAHLLFTALTYFDRHVIIVCEIGLHEISYASP